MSTIPTRIFATSLTATWGNTQPPPERVIEFQRFQGFMVRNQAVTLILVYFESKPIVSTQNKKEVAWSCYSLFSSESLPGYVP